MKVLTTQREGNCCFSFQVNRDPFLWILDWSQQKPKPSQDPFLFHRSHLTVLNLWLLIVLGWPFQSKIPSAANSRLQSLKFYWNKTKFLLGEWRIKKCIHTPSTNTSSCLAICCGGRRLYSKCCLIKLLSFSLSLFVTRPPNPPSKSWRSDSK